MDKLLGGAGFTLLMLGGGSMDSGSMIAPVFMVIAGLVLLTASAKESGEFRKRK